MTGLLSALVFGPSTALPLLIAPIGASAVLLFAVPTSPLAQPWSIIGGNMVSAAVGVTCASLIHDPSFAAAAAVACAIAAMFALRCLHPPGGAIALSAVLGGPAIHSMGYRFIISPVGINSLLLLTVAILFNNGTRRRYPHAPHLDHKNTHGTADAKSADRIGFTPADLEDVLKQYNQVLDVSRDELESLFMQTEMHAYRRRFGEITCGDIMSRDLVAVEFGTPLAETWSLMRKHHLKVLPVIDQARRVIGMIGIDNFLSHASLDMYDGFEAKLRRFIRGSRRLKAVKPQVAGQIMTKPVITAGINMHVVELVPILTDTGLHHIPIIDEERRLAGMVSQSDLISALYRGPLLDSRKAA
uniref:HPP family protein n=1 Tax=Noviherbaspirillum massiliense TaxID=1465823 RepID=UPI001FDF3ED8|nr:HPP family protein [Noviherbaspirillum massiliense]